MTDLFFNRVATLFSEELDHPMQYFYLSFAGDTFNGAVVVKAHGITDAMFKVNALDINPGGEALCVLIPENKTPDPKFCDRILTKDEAQQMWNEPCKTIREWDEEEGANGSE